MRFLSPLRYPGGKAFLADFLGPIVDKLSPTVERYAEPFAGGGGAALRLLIDEHVSRVHINDVNRGIAEFWRCVFDRTDAFVERLLTTPATVEEWHRQRCIYREGAEQTGMDLGFATFFLNRTNRSGILGARPIGGLEQRGRWKIDARYNQVALADRIHYIARYRNRVSITHLDAVEFLKTEVDPTNTLVYADPPYLAKSEDLYLDECDWATHEQVANLLRTRFPYWLVSYDDDRRVRDELYPSQPLARFTMSHSAAVQRFGTELAVMSPGVARIADLSLLGTRGAEQAV